MHFLVPSDPLNRNAADEIYAEEAAALSEAGLVSLFSFEDFEGGTFRPRPVPPLGSEVVYRGWMMMPDSYERLASAVADRGSRMLTSPYYYRLCHYLPEWYALCADLTPRTVFASEKDDFTTLLASTGRSAFFVKDYVKSLTTERGSIARSADEVGEIVDLIRRYRGQVEGGVCIREFVELKPGSEDRYFVVNGTASARTGSPPDIVHEVARRVASPFFSVDVAITSDGTPLVIELGDGQVSDRKEWSVPRLLDVLGVPGGAL
jgi:hypothetical protein